MYNSFQLEECYKMSMFIKIYNDSFTTRINFIYIYIYIYIYI